MDRDFGPRFTLAELVEATGVSRRNVRYYIDEGLVPRASGKGRYAYYTSEHVETLAKIRELRDRNLSIDEIRTVLEGERKPDPSAVSGETWQRIALHPDIELHVRDDAPQYVKALAFQIQSTAARWFGEDDDESAPFDPATG